MASILNVDQINNAAGTSAVTIDSSGNPHMSGHVLQVVHGTLPTTLSATGASASQYLVNIGLSASITPKASNSKILIQTHLYIGMDHANSSGYLQSYLIYKAGSVLNSIHGTSESGRRQVAGSINMYDTGTHAHYRMGVLSGTHMETNVGTTNATTYEIYMRSYSGGPIIYVNRTQTYQVSSADAANYDHNPSSTITLMEIAQ